jgi:acyl-ACP thioesterase
VRAVDVDIVDHVNNAAYWAVAVEELARRGRPRVTSAEIEFRAGLNHGEPVAVSVGDRADGFALWLTVAGDVRASMLIGCAT